jgi:hypothetical protein
MRRVVCGSFRIDDIVAKECERPVACLGSIFCRELDFVVIENVVAVGIDGITLWIVVVEWRLADCIGVVEIAERDYQPAVIGKGQVVARLMCVQARFRTGSTLGDDVAYY